MAFTEKYVTPSGAGTNDGLSEANAFSWAQFITDFNLQSAGGVRYNVKQGTYSGLSTATLTGDGTATSPLVVRGYKTTIGDATLPRTSVGLVDDSNMPHLQFNASARLAATGATYTVFESIRITSSNIAVLVVGGNSLIFNCKLTNTGTNVVAEAMGDPSDVVHCDLISSGTGGGLNSTGFVIGCRITSVSTNGIGIDYYGGLYSIIGNLIVGFNDGLNVGSAFAKGNFVNNTIVGVNRDGIVISASATRSFQVVNNHITGSGRYGINLNTPNINFILLTNRFRNNTSGNFNTGGDWAAIQQSLDITTAGTNSDDFVDTATGDYSLKATASGAGKGYHRLLSIGAFGSAAGSGGGGSALHLGNLGQTGIGFF
jgi:hypothetical protein